MKLYEYYLYLGEDIDKPIKLYHNDSFTTNDILNIVNETLIKHDKYLSSIKNSEDLVYELVYLLCEDGGFIYKDWIEYKHSVSIHFMDIKELKKTIREQLYDI